MSDMEKNLSPEPKRLPHEFASRDALINFIAQLDKAPDDMAAGSHPPERRASPIIGGRQAALAALAKIDPVAYASSRNHLNGAVTGLSAYIRHGVLSLGEVRDHALATVGTAKQAEKFIQELAWRDYWQRLYASAPDSIWTDVEAYKTGFSADDYENELPEDIAAGKTGVACIDGFIGMLLDTGYLHNHARLYVAAYVVHWRRIKWQAGARWFLQQLIDADPASNNLSWQWVASTFSNKPYFFNLDNVARYVGPDIDITPAANAPLAHSYERLEALLFPNRAADGER
jgi:deoxyribodipyrimidine photo-lyase